MEQNEFVYKLTVDTSGTETDGARRALESLKKQILETEQEVGKLKRGIKEGSTSINEASGPLSQYEAKLKALRTTFNETARAATGLEGFTQKIGKQFRDAVGPINDLVGRLGPIGNVINQVSAKLGEIGKASAGSADGVGKLNGFTSALTTGASGALLAVGALAGGIAALGVGIASSVAAYDESIKASRQLEVALNGNTEAAKRLQDQAQQLQDITGIPDESITRAQAFAASLGLTAEQIQQLTPAVVDLAAATGQDVESAFESVATTLSGGRDALKKYGIELDAAASKSEQVGQVIDGLSGKFGGQAEIIGTSGANAIKSFQTQIGELEEVLGRIIVQGIEPFVIGLTSVIRGLNDFVSGNDELEASIAASTENLQRQQAEFATLIVSLQDVNLKEDERKKIIEELNTKYPKYIGNIDLEKASTAQLNEVLAKGNSLFIAKLALVANEERLKELAKEQADAAFEQAKAQAALVDVLRRKILAQNDAGDAAELALLAEGKQLTELSNKYGLLTKETSRAQTGIQNLKSSGVKFDTNDVDQTAIAYEKAARATAKAAEETNKFADEIIRAADILGVESEVVTEVTGKLSLQGQATKDAFAALDNGTASVAQLEKVSGTIAESLNKGTLSADGLARSLETVNKALSQAQVDPSGNKAIIDQLTIEKDRIEKQIASLNEKVTSTTTKTNKAVVDSYEDRTKKIATAYDLELSKIDESENRKLITQIEADTRRNQALSRFLDERIKLETDAAEKAAEKNGGEIPIDFKLRINGLEEEKRKVDGEVEKLKLEAQAKIREIAGKVELQVSADLSELERQLSDAVAFDDLRRSFEDAFAGTANSVSNDVREALLNAAADGTIDFGGLIANGQVPKEIVEDLRKSYELFRLTTERNRITLVRDQQLEELDSMKKRFEELTRIVAELDQKKADPTVTLTAEEEASYTAAKEELNTLDGSIKEVTLKVNADTSELDKIGAAIGQVTDQTTGNQQDTGKSFFADLFGISDEEAEIYVGGAIDLANAVGDAIFQAQQAQIERRLALTNQAIADERDVTLRGIEDRVNAGLITEQEAERLREKANKDAEERRRKAAKEAVDADRKIKTGQATIAFFSELAQLALSSRTLPPGASEIYYGIQAGISAARYAANLAAINSTPVAAKGTVVKAQDGMMAQGPSHADGGILGLVGNKPAVELEGGEAIINKRSSDAFAPLLSAINSFKGWGIPLAASGGRITRGTALVNARYTEDDLEEMLAGRMEEGGIVHAPSISVTKYALGGMVPSVIPRFDRGGTVPPTSGTYRFDFGGVVPKFELGGMIPADGTIANRRQLEIATANSTERVVKLNGDQRVSKYTVYVDDLSRKMDGIRDAENNVTFGI